jgi:DNA polymerase elongation subunit (family B)
LTPFDQLKNLLFIDIETASVVEDYAELPERMKPLWDKKGKRLEAGMEVDESFFKWAPIFAEFGRIITIGVGYFLEEADKSLTFKVTHISHDSEAEILTEFKSMIDRRRTNKKNPERKLVAHNGLEFDYPYICRRMLINGISLPKSLNLTGKKPWEIPHLDTLNMWKFGEYRHFTSLELLATLFGIESSKTDLDGSQVNTTYYHKKDLEAISYYCMQDVIVTAKLYLKLISLPNLEDEHIVFVEKN